MNSFRSNLCAFLGRKKYITILHLYIERCLHENIIDRYYLFDLSKNLEDHFFLLEESKRLSLKFPNRVFLENYEKRDYLLKKNSIDAVSGKWGAFYSYLSNFDDNDIIIKIDDDTLFIDPEGLKEALEVRWSDQSAFIMHSNCINNGICAYHQSESKIWKFKDERINMYPEGGIAGPLFLWPELTQKCHEQFLEDVSIDSDNINNYKLGKNIYSNSRISINFTFFLGRDRNHLVGINEQDEYLLSSKIPQNLGRSNMIIGDFITSHYSYGVQEPLLSRFDFLKKYKDLAEKFLEKPRKALAFHKSTNKCSTIKFKENYICKSWVEEDYFTIKNLRTEKYMGLDLKPKAKIDFGSKKPSGDFLIRSVLSGSDKPQAFKINGNIYNNNEVLQTRDLKKISQEFQASFVSKFFQENFSKNGIDLIPTKNKDEYLIESSVEKNAFLFTKEDKSKSNIFYFFKKDGKRRADFWEIKPQSHLSNKIILSKIIQNTSQEFENDSSYMEASFDPLFPKHVLPRSYQWTLDKHLWEFENIKDNSYHIACINNKGVKDYLTLSQESLSISTSPRAWEVQNIKGEFAILDPQSKKYLNCEEQKEIILSFKPSLFRIKL